MRIFPVSTLLVVMLAAPATAKEGQALNTAPDAATSMRQAAEICLRNYRQTEEIPGALTGAGYTLVPGMDAGSFEVSAPGLWGVVAPAEGYCMFQSKDVPLSGAQAIGRDLGDTLFPGKVEDGHPERGMVSPCDGISIFAPRSLLWIHYSQAGNSGECIDDGTSAIILNM